MTDITKVFRALIKAKQASSNFNFGLNERSKKVSTDFLSRAKQILHDIIKLKYFLLESRTIYLSPFYLSTPTNKIMTDEQRTDFETNTENQIRQCRDQLEQLKSSIGQICFQGQRRSNFEFVCAYLERHLVQCTKIYSELKCLRYKRESERKKIGRLDTHDQQITLNFDQNTMRKRLNTLTTEETKPSTTTIENTSNSINIISNFYEQDNQNENDEENQLSSPQPTGSELRQLQRENEQLYHDVAKRSEEIHSISSQVVEIAQLQNELFNNIFVQKDLIQQVDVSAEASNDDLAAAIIHIRDAIRNSAQMRRWVIFFLLVMIFSLLFLDWYNI